MNTQDFETVGTVVIDDEQPFRMELFNTDQRRERGRALAQEHAARTGLPPSDTSLLARLLHNGEAIERVRRKLVDDVMAKRPVTPVGEWLVDNYYVIEEQISLAERHLPKKYLTELPGLRLPGGKVLPRVYDIAEHIVGFGDGRVDVEDISAVVEGYQSLTPLKIGELWAIPIMLRLALLENLRRISAMVDKSRQSRNVAAKWARRLIRVDRDTPGSLVLVIAEMAQEGPFLSDSFVAEFKRLLQGRGSGMKIPLQWVEHSLADEGRSIEQSVAEDNRDQAALELSMRNSINSLRNINVTDWNEFVENTSLVESTLRRDPAGVYAHMDFATRDEYRRLVANIAKGSGNSETDIAAKCLELAKDKATSLSVSPETTHVGYYLLGDGEETLKKAVGFKGTLGERIRDASAHHTLHLYLGSIFVMTVTFTALSLWLISLYGIGDAMLMALTIPILFCVCHVAVGLANFASTVLVKPRGLPRMNFVKGIPPEWRTLVVVPVIVGNTKTIDRMIRNLETHYLNNRGDNIHFGLLTDFPDASGEIMPQDAELLEACVKGIDTLNEKYPEDGGDNFFLFHRPRKWNPEEEIWMAYERKRGKLEDLNRFLTDGDSRAFSRLVGRTERLAGVKYVITLDADTMLPRESAWQMAGTMAHVLNHPHYDRELGRVTSGHGILQPRVDSCLSGATRTPYSRMMAGEIGIDPYTRASSDVYQDLFDEGSFIGKGIYDVETFNTALGGRFPDNKILSHDLLEGCVVRSGLLNDVKLYEDPPTSYLMDIFRRHRWVRGDWQIAGYLFPGPIVNGDKQSPNPLTPLSKWKVFDNLRRSLTALFVLAALILGLVSFTCPWLFILIVGCVFVIPVVMNAFASLVRKSPDKTFGQHLSKMMQSTGNQAVQALFKFACLPFEAYVNTDAIVRSVWRQLVSKRLLLQWTPSDNTYNEKYTRFWPLARRMWMAPFLAATTLAALWGEHSAILLYALPLCLLWIASPLIASRLSKPYPIEKDSLSGRQHDFLRAAARRIWLFFEDYVTPEDNWLPPDNHQEFPSPKTAHRTSPTNMGLSLLANLSAYDFGFISAGTMLERCANALGVMRSMERFRGHFYNWYDTRSLEILKPAYISTVDSGNLAAHLLVLASGLRELSQRKIILPEIYRGLLDAVELAIGESDDGDRHVVQSLESLRDDARSLVDAGPDALSDIYPALDGMASKAEAVLASWPAADSGESQPEAKRWLRAFLEQCRDAIRELDLLCPWAKTLAEPGMAETPEILDRIPSLAEIAALPEKLAESHGGALSAERVEQLAQAAADNANARLAQIQNLLIQCEDLSSIEYDFLYDEKKRLLAIGYNVDERRPDQSYYDLLASEARLAVYLGIAQNKLPQASWFALGRTLTMAEGRPLLVSWGGTMFEYLMPLLVMPTFHDTLLDETYRAVVAIQAEYGKAEKVPWGISESGYNVFDAANNYQYRAFGVPELGLKHGLSDELVVSPYSTLLAAMVSPKLAVENMERMHKKGFQSPYGFYEAIDYTPSRLPKGRDCAIVKSYMAHHQGMSLVALGQALLDRPMHRRFEADPRLAALSMLLQEMVPTERALYYHSTYSPEIRVETQNEASPMRVLGNPNSPRPEIQLLSNGRYHVMVTAAGGGYSRWQDLAVTRWREDATRDNWGAFCYLRDLDSGEIWSTAYQPVLGAARRFESVFSEGKAEFKRWDAEFDTHTEIVVSPEDDVEVRRVKVTNKSRTPKKLHLTSFAEIALAKPDADDSHQAFSKLFVETALVPSRQAIVFSRRPRRPDERHPLAFHLLALRGTQGGVVSYETDRLAFVGRGRDASRPGAVYDNAGPLAGGSGAVLDPVAAIRTEIALGAGETVTVDLISGVAADRAGVDILLEKYQNQHMADKAFDLAWTHGQLVLRQLDVSETEAQLFCRMAGPIVYANPVHRASPSTIQKNRKGQSGLWGYSISGDLPVVLLRIEDPERFQLVRQMIKAHSYWRQKGLAVDLVIWNEDQSGYRQSLHDTIVDMAGLSLEGGNLERPGGIFVRIAERVAEDDRTLIQTVARVILCDADGMLEEQIHKQIRSEVTSSTTVIQYRQPEVKSLAAEALPKRELLFDNGYGGFTPDGREYVVHGTAEKRPPLPWVNVMANPSFGTVVSESGSSCTWSENAHEFRLTPWENDPVSDAGGEAFYIRDERTGEFWSPTPYPSPDDGDYVARHGFGYSVFEHKIDGIFSETTVFVDWEAPIKFTTIKIRNDSLRPRSLSVTGYVEWVLGALRHKTAMYLVTSADPASGAIFAANRYNDEFRSRTAFFDVDDPGRTLTGDRSEFLGRNGSAAKPFALQRANLSGKVGAGLDPCGALQVRFNLAPGQERTVVFRLGVGENHEAARRMVHELRGGETAALALNRVKENWKRLLEAVQVETPDKAFDIMANGWLLYQALSCRFWGRSATYQSGGAFGFRDQLQDSLAFLYSDPSLTRRHILLSAEHQFVEGDAMHWWHPPTGRGVRTRCSDDYLWLPYVAVRYAEVTGDNGIWGETAGYVQGRTLKEGEESYYDLPERSEIRESIYDHCKKSILHGLRLGEHGLPLMGSGDWNDGMDLVGIEGRGESVWLGFFLYSILVDFAGIAEARGDDAFAGQCREAARTLRSDLEAHSWDDEWYRRAYFDDGAPLGSKLSPECKIDSIAQSWSVLSGVGERKRTEKAMRALDSWLVDRENKIVKLFTPAFDTSDLNPGYIKGYVPGVRENGGQYTHAAVWAGMAFAKLGMADKTWEILNLLNPINHALNREDADIYKVEPYVVSADVYSAARHAGRGGWSWYTGSASWLYRFMLESILGFTVKNDFVTVSPCVPADWSGFTIRFRLGETRHTLIVKPSPDADDASGEPSPAGNGWKKLEVISDGRGRSHELGHDTASSRGGTRTRV